MSDKYIPNSWTPEEWQKQMYSEVKVGYRLSEMGYLEIGDELFDQEFADKIDAEFDLWLTKHDAEVAEATEKRIIKLIDACPKDEQWHLDNLMCCEGRCDFSIQDYQERLIELIKGETNE